MKHGQKTLFLILVVLLFATVYGLIRTGRETNPANPAQAVSPEQTALVDHRPFFTAQALVQMPARPVELRLAQSALQLGDELMDLAFASALLDATQHPAVLTAEAKKIQGRLQEAETALTQQQAEVARLTAAEAATNGVQKDALDDQLDLAKAQLELCQDEVDDAKQDLIRAGGDPLDRIRTMVQEHEAASHASDSTKVAVTETVEPRGLIQHFQQWSALHQKQLQLRRAQQDAVSSAATLAVKHDSLEKQLDAQKEVAASAAASLKTTKRNATDRKTLTNLDKQIDTEKRLADVYAQWSDVVAVEQQSLVNGALSAFLIIVVTAIVGILLNDWVKRLLRRTTFERRRVATLQATTRVSLQIAGVLLVLLVIFGPPSELGTFLGLAGAGLTVALKDFILGFIGWLVLMGKNGIRLGDWVEINGVTGEVVELGIFQTVLMETGNWTDSGHPTGRRVTFSNNFAVEGHYFNFSTSGQWLWDELQMVLPTGHNPYPIVDAIQQKVLEATSESARLAEEEWKRSAVSHDMERLSAAPAINIKPVIGGTAISVRYITSAKDRFQLRARLNHDAVDVLGGALAPKADADPKSQEVAAGKH